MGRWPWRRGLGASVSVALCERRRWVAEGCDWRAAGGQRTMLALLGATTLMLVAGRWVLPAASGEREGSRPCLVSWTAAAAARETSALGTGVEGQTPSVGDLWLSAVAAPY